MMACGMRNKTHLLFQILVASVFLTLCMNAIVISSVAEMVPAPSNTTMVNRCIETERQALLLIKQCFVDKDWLLSSWGSPQEENCCHWRRVGCDNRTGHVTHLMLSDVSYESTDSVSNISHSLLKLKNLKYLDLSGNNFGEQPIPRFVGSLSKLVYLNLAYSNFKGAIPEEIGNLSRLHHLDLSTNRVSNISHSLLKLKNLKYLDLSWNEFGEHPIPRFVGSLSNLVYLSLSSAKFRGAVPEEIGNLSRLHHLDLSGNSGLEGGSFGWLIPLSFLTHLDLSSCNMSGNLEDILNVLPEDSLEKLWISRNKFTGPLSDISRFSSLTKLDAKSNQLNGYLPKIFQHRSVLRYLYLWNNHLRGSLPSFTGFSHLEALDLSWNNFSGSLPQFTGMQSLKVLDLQQNEFSGSLPAFTGLQSLEDLYLVHNKFSGGLPDFTGCSSLRELRLAENEITEWKTQSIGQLTNLTDLDLSKNSIHSTITESHLSNLSRLQYLDTSSNSLTFNFSPRWLPPFQLSTLDLSVGTKLN